MSDLMMAANAALKTENSEFNTPLISSGIFRKSLKQSNFMHTGLVQSRAKPKGY